MPWPAPTTGVARRKDGTTFPAEISLSPVATATGSYTLIDSITTSLYSVGLGLQTASDLPHDAASRAIGEALRHLDDTIRRIRDSVFTAHGQETYPPSPHGTG